MPDTPATNVETAGVYGQTGAIPVGSMATSGEVKDTTEIGGAGSVTARPESPVLSATPDTEGVYGPNDPGDFSPVSTLLTGTQDTTMGYAAPANMAAPVYREPSIGVPVTLYESDRAYGYAEPVPQENYPWVTDGTVETASFGAIGGHISTQTDTLTIDATTAAPTRPGGIADNAPPVVATAAPVAHGGDRQLRRDRRAHHHPDRHADHRRDHARAHPPRRHRRQSLAGGGQHRPGHPGGGRGARPDRPGPLRAGQPGSADGGRRPGGQEGRHRPDADRRLHRGRHRHRGGAQDHRHPGGQRHRGRRRHPHGELRLRQRSLLRRRPAGAGHRL